MTDLPLQSATQIELWTQCRRKWAFKYLEHITVPPSAGAELGTEVQDTQLDPYLATGRNFDFSRPVSAEIALTISPLLPKPMAPGMVLRRKFVIPSPTGRFAYRGEFDMWAPSSEIVPGLAARRAPGDGPAPLLQDTKTTKYLDFAKTTEVLKTDIQCQLYGAAIMFQDEVDELDALWVYGKTVKRYRAQSTYLRMRAPEVFEQFERIDAIASELVTIKLARPAANDLPPTVRMCDQFGGCPYQFKCNLSPTVQAAAVNEEAKMSSTPNPSDFLANLRKTTGTTAAPAAPPPPPAAPAAPALPPGVYFQAPGGAPIRVEAPPGTPGTFTVHAAGPEAVLQPGVYAQPAPKPAPPPPEAPAALPAWATAPVDPMHARHAQTPAAINPPESALPPAPPVGAAAPAAPPPAETARKRGRPAKAEGEPASIDLPALVAVMRQLGVKRFSFEDGREVELFEVHS